MHPVHRMAELLAVAWKLGGSKERIPTSHGILDRAIKAVYDSKQLPEWAMKELHFAESRVGLQCVELPDVLEWAQRSQLTSAPNPSYESTQVQISDRLAQSFVSDLELSVDQVRALGNHLYRAVRDAKQELAAFEYGRIEDY